MWYYENYIESSDISCKLFHNSYGQKWEGGKGAYNNIAVGVLSEVPNFSVNHEWKDSSDSSWKGIAASILRTGNNIYRSASGFINSDSSTYSTAVQPNTNILKQFAGTSINFNIPDFIKVFLCDDSGVDTRQKAQAFINQYKLFGDEGINMENIIQKAPGDFKYEREYELDMLVKGSFALATNKFIIRNLLPKTVSVTFSDNTVADIRCPLFIKIDISWEFGKIMTSNELIKFIGGN